MTLYKKYKRELVNFRIYIFFNYLEEKNDYSSFKHFKKLALKRDKYFLSTFRSANKYENFGQRFDCNTDALSSFAAFIRKNRKILEGNFKLMYFGIFS